MVLAGIDEAGYGPLLGPLVVGCAAFEIPGVAAAGDWPDIWALLRRVISKRRVEGKLHVNDSKKVYSSAIGLKPLETAVLALSACRFGNHQTLEEFLACVAMHVVSDMPGHRWYCDACAFPLQVDAMAARIMANALRFELSRVGVSVAHLAARVVLEKNLNQMFQRTRNKASALFSYAAVHLDELIRNFADKGLVIVCDRQGGRGHYGQLLRLMFEDWDLAIEAEREDWSEYRLSRGGQCVRIVFTMQAENKCASTAVASMLSKYLRESFMTRFNAFWQRQLPGIRPTAGYYDDGMRFLKEIDLKRRELGIEDAMMVRSR